MVVVVSTYPTILRFFVPTLPTAVSALLTKQKGRRQRSPLSSLLQDQVKIKMGILGPFVSNSSLLVKINSYDQTLCVRNK